MRWLICLAFGLSLLAAPAWAQTGAERVFRLAQIAPSKVSSDYTRAVTIPELAKLGFVEGKNLQLKKAHAQGEMGNIPSILQNLANQYLDLIVPMTTPLLTGAIGLVKKTPVVFTVVYDPISAGVGP